MRELQPGHESMQINTKTASVTLTFEIGAWFFLVTHHLDMHKRITVWTGMVEY